MRKAALLNWLAYRSAVRSRRRKERPKWSVGIYKGDRLGDFVLSLGSIRAIAEAAGAENCVLFHSSMTAQLAAREFPELARIQLPDLDGKLWVTRRRMRERNFLDQVGGGVAQLICLRHFRTLSEELALQSIPAHDVWCISNSDVFSVDYEIVRERFNGDVTVNRPMVASSAWTCEDLNCHQQLLRSWSGDLGGFGDLRPRLDRVESGPGKTLAIAPFGSSRIRDLPIEGVAACIIQAKKSRGLSSELLVPPGGEKQYRQFAARLGDLDAPVELRSTPTTNDLVDRLAGSMAVLTTETAIAHLATALDLPMLCVVGGGHYGLFSPWSRSERQVWLTHRTPCFNCNWHCSQSEPYCITHVAPREMAAALERVLGLGGPAE
ncbi:MAG TPA: glycosyltransferase family 9 protein [Opitutaceae bacterium]|nr:glycosyltransferase family 9 protein [Opitutaceae bacterium]